jgi:hypothetical protein
LAALPPHFPTLPPFLKKDGRNFFRPSWAFAHLISFLLRFNLVMKLFFTPPALYNPADHVKTLPMHKITKANELLKQLKEE